MKKTKKPYDGDINDLIFEEEVPESNLHSKKKQNDIIYVNGGISRFGRTVIYVLLFLILLFSILSMMFSMFGSHHKIIGGDGTEVNYILNVIQPNEFSGEKAMNFKNYKSLDKAYSYNFKVRNDNKKQISYKVNIVNPNFNLDSIAINDISYQLIKNDKEVKKGNLKDIDIFEVYSTDVSPNSTDSYTLKLWSDKIPDTDELSFKIDITL